MDMDYFGGYLSSEHLSVGGYPANKAIIRATKPVLVDSLELMPPCCGNGGWSHSPPSIVRWIGWLAEIVGTIVVKLILKRIARQHDSVHPASSQS
jgi:hypothetical protein